MSEARGRFEWSRVSALMALLVNMFRDKKSSKIAKPEDFNPYYEKKAKNVPIVPLTLLKDLLVKGDLLRNG